MRRGILATCFLLWGIMGAVADGSLIRTNNQTITLPTTLNTSGYRVVPAITNVIFDWPTVVNAPPGETNRLFVTQKNGMIYVITNLANPTKTLFLDFSDISGAETEEQGTLGMDFHPGYATNGYFYVFLTSYVNGQPADCLVRFSVDPNDPNHALRNSSTMILYQLDATWNHNAGDVHFGKDGYLYVSLGDPWQLCQQITQLFSGMIRIDVDKRPGNLKPNNFAGVTTNYLIPADNPYVGATSFLGAPVDPDWIRTEFYAVGLRNPWRWSVDSLTGDIYVADVGEWNWEEVNLIQAGQNYGWDFAEGFDPYSYNYGDYVSYLTDPIYVYSHDDGPAAIIGGPVYRGTNADLYGNYIFSDYCTGVITAFKYQDGEVIGVRTLGNNPAIVCYGTDPRNGDVLMASSDGTISKLALMPVPTNTSVPTLLSQTGIFTDVANLITQPGLQPYTVSIPFWSDNARKRRWISVPAGQTIQFDPTNVWTFPTGTVWVKHFDLQTNAADSNSWRKIETRVLVKTDDGAYGLSYAWKADQSDAVLVDSGGAMSNYTHVNSYVQPWIYPAQNDCLTCHVRHSGFSLGCNTAQWNCDMTNGALVTNQLQAMSDAGYFSAPITNRYTLPLLADLSNTNLPAEFRARSYLAANCAQCHEQFGWGFGNWDARIATPLAGAGIINGVLNDDTWMSALVPGDPNDSMILQRLEGNYGRMPPLASTILDENGINLITEWIMAAPARHLYDDWATNIFGKAADPLADADGDGLSNYGEYLAGTDPQNAASKWMVSFSGNSTSLQLSYARIPNRIYEIQWTTNLAQPWQPLNAPVNRPIPTATNDMAMVNLGPPDALPRFYRVAVRDP